ncbi:gliding motility lipoprotein GldH [Pedobacter alpinus]|uniref:Gliding motility lipoprotein GldH n=1 Tax=Pedobacter alpinus TaxID=1590643 RepID=A0ABW5TRT7_9SPHI
MHFFKRIFFLGLTLSVLQACNTDNVVVDSFEKIPKETWSYINPIKASVTVTDSTKAYNIYVNFRHTSDYKYANIWLRFHIIGPNKKDIPLRQEFQLAEADGKWLGTGSGNLYNYQLIFKDGYKFPGNGKYTLIVEQNMRDNPLKAISDVGLYVELAK